MSLCSTNRQLTAAQTEECPAHIEKPKKNSSEYHCTKEEWDNAKPFNQIPGPVPLPVIGNTWRFLPKIGNNYISDLNSETKRNLIIFK